MFLSRKKREVVEVSSLEDVKNIDKGKSTRYIKLNCGGLDHSLQARWEKSLNKYCDQCGCTIGAYFLWVALFCLVCYGIVTGKLIPLNFNYLKVCLICTFASAFGGKVIGMIYTRARYKSVIKCLYKFFEVPLKQSAQETRCDWTRRKVLEL